MRRFTRFVVAASVCVGAVLALDGTVSASPPAIYVVKDGDSLGRIARKLGVALP